MSAVISKMKGNAASKVSGYFISENKRVALSKRGSRKKRLCLTCTEVLQKSEARNQSDLNDLDHVHRAILAKSMLLVLMVKLNKISSTSEGNKGRTIHWMVRWLAFVTRHLLLFEGALLQRILRKAGHRTRHNRSSKGQHNRSAAPLIFAEMTDYCLSSSGSNKHCHYISENCLYACKWNINSWHIAMKSELWDIWRDNYKYTLATQNYLGLTQGKK